MGKSVMVSIDNINRVLSGLYDLKCLVRDEAAQSKVNEIIELMNKNFVSCEDKDINIIKKLIYNRMIATLESNVSENRELYQLYQETKRNKIDENEVLERFREIEKRYGVIK